jgi:ariadne-1
MICELTGSLKRNNMTELFEDNQRDLERAVENLSFLLEQPIENQKLAKLRQDITNESVSLVILTRTESG